MELANLAPSRVGDCGDDHGDDLLVFGTTDETELRARSQIIDQSLDILDNLHRLCCDGRIGDIDERAANILRIRDILEYESGRLDFARVNRPGVDQAGRQIGWIMCNDERHRAPIWLSHHRMTGRTRRSGSR